MREYVRWMDVVVLISAIPFIYLCSKESFLLGALASMFWFFSFMDKIEHRLDDSRLDLQFQFISTLQKQQNANQVLNVKTLDNLDRRLQSLESIILPDD